MKFIRPNRTLKLPKLMTGSGHLCSMCTHTSILRKIHPKHQTSPKMTSQLTGAAWISGVATLGYLICNDQQQKPVIDQSVLRDEKYDNSKVSVIDALEFKSTGGEKTSGRSHGYKAQRKNNLGKHEYYYYKEPFNRTTLLNELVLGAIGRETCGEIFPRTLAVETPVNNINNDSRYGIASQSLGGIDQHSNLEDWAQAYFNNAETCEYYPKHLGTSLAFDMLFGKTDSKLANLIVLQGENGSCYPIDHESGFNLPPAFITNPMDALEFIGEFKRKQFTDLLREGQANGLATSEGNIHQPLKDNKAVKNSIEPVLLAAIQNDIDSGNIRAFYEKFANMPETTFRYILQDQYGSLFKENEQKEYLEKLLKRQQMTKQYIATFEKNDKDSRKNTNEEPLSLSCRAIFQR